MPRKGESGFGQMN